jgi:methanol metabolism-related c-type cytochrome
MFRITIKGLLALGIALAIAGAYVRFAHGGEDGVRNEVGGYVNKDGAPTYKIAADGTVDWSTYSGFRRYHSVCYRCHGPDGQGSSFAPALADSLKTMGYEEFQATVVNGRARVGAVPNPRPVMAAWGPGHNSVMPQFGIDRNVMCYLDDIYIYLKARADGVLPPGRPAKHEPQPQANKDFENRCMGF